MKVKEFIEILQDFPQDSNIAFVNEYEEEYYHFFALHHVYESDEYNNEITDEVRLILIDKYHHYNELVHEEREVSTWFKDEQVYYNTTNGLETWNCENQRVMVYYNPETRTFEEKKYG